MKIINLYEKKIKLKAIFANTQMIKFKARKQSDILFALWTVFL